MRYRTKVMFATKKHLYKQGELLPEDIASEDLSFLKSKKFVEVVDVSDRRIFFKEESKSDKQELPKEESGFDELELDSLEPDDDEKVGKDDF